MRDDRGVDSARRRVAFRPGRLPADCHRKGFHTSIFRGSIAAVSVALTLGAATVEAQAPVSSPTMTIETPASGAIVGASFSVSGWAIDAGASTDTGVDTVQIFAYPNPGSGTPTILLGVADYGTTRADVGAVYGSQFTNSGYLFHISSGIGPGPYQLVVYAHSVVSGLLAAQALNIIVPAPLEHAGSPSQPLVMNWRGA